MTFTIPLLPHPVGRLPQLRPQRPFQELSLMQQDGLLDTYRSSFKLLEPEALRQMIL